MLSGIGGGVMDVAMYALQSKQAQLDMAVGVEVLKTAMESEEAIMNKLLGSMGIGNQVNVLA